jgi:small subunit ribosomal protein S6
MRTYELIIVFDSSVEIEQIESDLKRFQEIMIRENGFVRLWERWGKQRLAYEIRRRQYGYYTLVVFDTDPSLISELDRLIRLTPTILRHLITVVDPVRVPEIDEESVKTLGAARPGTVHTVAGDVGDAIVAITAEAGVVVDGSEIDEDALAVDDAIVDADEADADSPEVDTKK